MCRVIGRPEYRVAGENWEMKDNDPDRRVWPEYGRARGADDRLMPNGAPRRLTTGERATAIRRALIRDGQSPPADTGTPA
jgi:hypothetical protein